MITMMGKHGGTMDPRSTHTGARNVSTRFLCPGGKCSAFLYRYPGCCPPYLTLLSALGDVRDLYTKLRMVLTVMFRSPVSAHLSSQEAGQLPRVSGERSWFGGFYRFDGFILHWNGTIGLLQSVLPNLPLNLYIPGRGAS